MCSGGWVASRLIVACGLALCVSGFSQMEAAVGRAGGSPSSAQVAHGQEMVNGVSALDVPLVPRFNEETNIALNQLASECVARVAVLDLRGIRNPAREDARFCADLLELASRLDPENGEILRHRIEAAYLGDDADTMQEATATLVRIDPHDTVAQLRLIASRLNALQTREERAAAYERLLGPQGATLDPSVRSRLALDAALLAREGGDEKLFVQRLKQATSLDGTNKEAAILALSYHSERVKDVREHFELLANLLYADPLDIGTLTQLRDELAAQGAWEQAARFHRLVSALVATGGSTSFLDRLVQMGIEWRTKGARVPHDALQRDLLMSREEQAKVFERSTRTIIAAEVQRAEDIRLAIPLEQMRLAAACALGDDDAIRASMNDLTASYGEQLAILRDPARRPSSMREDAAMKSANDLQAELNLWRLVTGVDLARARTEGREVLEQMGDEDGVGELLRVWLSVRGEDRSARELPEVDPSSGTPWLIAAVAQAALDDGDLKRASLLYRAAEVAEPLSPLGCLAGDRARKADPSMGYPLASEFDRLGKSIPNWIDAMLVRPSQHQRLTVEFGARDARALERVPVTVRLKNLAPIPLGLGATRPLCSRMLLTPAMEAGDRTLTAHLTGEVISLDRRLRLRPGEELVVQVRPELGTMGWVWGSASAKPTSVHFRLLQGVVSRPDGSRAAGPGCLDVSSFKLVRGALEASRMSPAQLAGEVASMVEESQTQRLAVATRAVLLAPRASGAYTDDHRALVGAWAARYPSLSVAARLIALGELPQAGEVPVMRAFDEVAKMDTNPDAGRMVLATRIASIDDPALESFAGSPDVRLARMARVHHNRLANNVGTYSVQGVMGGAAGVEALAPAASR